MTDTALVHSQSLALDVFSLLQSIDPSRVRANARDAMLAQIQQMAERIRAVIPSESPLGEPFGKVATVLDGAPMGQEASSEWESFRKQLHAAYDELAAMLRREAIDIPTVRPTNYVRSIFHVFSATTVLLCVQHVMTPKSMIAISGAFTLAAWGMEISRRVSPAANRFLMWVFGPVAHEHERRKINSSTWYTTALFLMALTVSPMAASVGLAVLGFADPAAGLIGRRFGRTKIRAGRSLEGSSTFFVVGLLASMATLAIYYPTLSLTTSLLLAGTATLTAALAELFVTKLDDNFTIPLAASLGLSAAAAIIGL